jgi:Phage terminase large subunit
MSEIFNPKQKRSFRRFIQKAFKRINFFEGSVSSGKTYITLILWSLWVMSRPPQSVHLMFGRTITSLERNCLLLLTELFGEENVQYSVSSKRMRLFGRLVWLEGADNERARAKIQGLTIDSVYGDELPLVPETFFNMVLSRMRILGSKGFFTGNPDDPTNYVKKNWIDRIEEDDLDMMVEHYHICDNSMFLPEGYIENL